MRYFICALDKINLGIPAEQTERIIQVSRVQTSIYETGDHSSVPEFPSTGGAFISLPALFRQEDAVFHGLVLKSIRPLTSDQTADDHAKTILLMPKIDIDMEIPEDAIHRLPEAFVGVFSFFTGAYFDGDGQSLILILNPQKLMEVYHD